MSIKSGVAEMPKRPHGSKEQSQGSGWTLCPCLLSAQRGRIEQKLVGAAEGGDPGGRYKLDLPFLFFFLGPHFPCLKDL